MLTEKMTAKDVLAAHWDGKVPVRPVAIASAMGVKVFKSNDLDVSGLIRLDGGQPKITYNANEIPVRQRFTIAHELGHYALGHLSGGKTMWRDPRENFYSSAHNPKEVEANRFAARLLMPADAVRLAVRNGVRNITALADLFQVSEVAMKYRLINLGMLNG